MRLQILVLAGLIAVAGVGGALVLNARDSQPANNASMRAAPAAEAGLMPERRSDNVVVPHPHPRFVSLTYYVLDEREDDIRLVAHTATMKAAGTPSVWRQVRTALQAMERFPAAEGTEHNPLPEGARVLGVHITDGRATVNMSRAFESNFGGGARKEQMTIYAIVNTVCQTKGVSAVSFEVEGRPITELGGHIDLSEPLVPDASLVESAP